MNVIQRPGTQEFSATMPDYIIDTDSTITFAVQYKGQTILNEEYSPDANNQVRVRQLGKFCAMALWGKWCVGSSLLQEDVAGTFTFAINDITDTTTYVLFSRLKTKKNAASPGWLTTICEKITRDGVHEYASILLAGTDKVLVTARTLNGAVETKTLYTNAGTKSVVTLDVSPDKIKSIFPGLMNIASYQVIQGSYSLKFYIDQHEYTEINQFLCKNVYDVPETVTTVGQISFKGNNESDSASVYGIERRFAVKVTDEYTVTSGAIFLQSDYKLWHNFVNAQENSIWQSDEWLSIVITKQNFEREYSKGALKEVVFNFQMADPEQNNMIEL